MKFIFAFLPALLSLIGTSPHCHPNLTLPLPPTLARSPNGLPIGARPQDLSRVLLGITTFVSSARVQHLGLGSQLQYFL
ncbi:hypothetical protein DFH94DRAFT_713525 [Russula ochroleuca]|uniref:Secreted protein n=1 Tax=Russula ochroleuca TaxID=152965 RepID=A0A9P5N4W6_9AGAM|nr:hypothetical protein DFH94DRAFT_713525 [Russula ochroleuca]